MTRAKIEMFDPEGRLVYTSHTRLERIEDGVEIFNYNVDVFKVLHVTNFSLIFDPKNKIFSVLKYDPELKIGNVVPLDNVEHQIWHEPDLFETRVLTDRKSGRLVVQATSPFIKQKIRELRVTIEA